MSNRVEDKTGGAINISEDIGKITGDILIPDDIDNLVDGLWFELKTVDLDGEENTYHLQLEVIETLERMIIRLLLIDPCDLEQIPLI